MNRMLLIDDDDDFRELLEEAFKGHGLDTVGVSTASQAIEALGETDGWRFVLTDLGLPDAQVGVQLIRDMRKRVSRSTVIVVSGSGMRWLEAAKRAGADIVLAKPVDIANLVKTVGRLMT